MKRLLILSLAVLSACACSKGEKTAATKSAPPEPMTGTAEPKGAPVEAGKVTAAGGGQAAMKVEGQGFIVEVQPPTSVSLNGEATAKVVLTPTSGYHVNKDFPIALKVKAPAGVEVVKADQVKADAAAFGENGATFEVKFTSKEAGSKAFEATFKFAVCTETTCDPKKEKLAWNVDVK